MKKILRVLKNTKGFTLVELIVVIAIIGILVAIAIPRMSGFTDSAKEANDKQLAKIIENSTAVLIASGKLANISSGEVNFTIENLGTGTAAPASSDAKIKVTGSITTKTLVDPSNSNADYTADKLTVALSKMVDPKATINLSTKKIVITVGTDGSVSNALADK